VLLQLIFHLLVGYRLHSPGTTHFSSRAMGSRVN
jgi:hypothetical protein